MKKGCFVKIPAFFLVLLVACQVCVAEPLRVTAAGDSLTVSYGSYLPDALDAAGVDAQTTVAAAGGLRARDFAGLTTRKASAPHDYVADVLASDPDVIILLIGINDAYMDSNPTERFNAYTAAADGILDEFTSFTNGRGQHPNVILSNLLPTTDPAPTGLNPRIDTLYNPWLEQEAAARGLTFIDANTLIVEESGGQSPYHPDGLHLTGDGYSWLADTYASLVPEPSGMLAVAALAGLVLRRRR
jgi:lysophospholipase L1-like esterase